MDNVQDSVEPPCRLFGRGDLGILAVDVATDDDAVVGGFGQLADQPIVAFLVIGEHKVTGAQTLALTAQARELVPELAALADANDGEFFGHLTPKDRAALLRILQGIVETRGLTSLPVD